MGTSPSRETPPLRSPGLSPNLESGGTLGGPGGAMFNRTPTSDEAEIDGGDGQTAPTSTTAHPSTAPGGGGGGGGGGAAVPFSEPFTLVHPEGYVSVEAGGGADVVYNLATAGQFKVHVVPFAEGGVVRWRLPARYHRVEHLGGTFYVRLQVPSLFLRTPMLRKNVGRLLLQPPPHTHTGVTGLCKR
jgi:hypothetical protein